MSFALRLVKSTRIFVADAECKVIGICASIINKKQTPGFRRIDDHTDRRPHLNDQPGDRKLTLGEAQTGPPKWLDLAKISKRWRFPWRACIKDIMRGACFRAVSLSRRGASCFQL
jgi:hypothetical protein